MEKDQLISMIHFLVKRMLRPMTVERKRSSSARLLPSGRKNMLPMTIGIKK